VCQGSQAGTVSPRLAKYQVMSSTSVLQTGALVAGDAVVTVQLNSLWGVLQWWLGRSKQHLAGPPWYSTWNWQMAKQSVATLSRLEPRVLACGHGPIMAGKDTAAALRALANYVW
jgi:hypothetical protein